MTKNKKNAIIFFISVFMGLSLCGSSFALTASPKQITFNDVDSSANSVMITNSINDNPSAVALYIGGHLNSLISSFTFDFWQWYQGVSPTQIGTFVLVEFNAEHSIDEETLSEAISSPYRTGDIAYITVYPTGYWNKFVFNFSSSTDTQQIGSILGSNVTNGVSNLWPVLIIVVGLVLVFYILKKIIDLFKMKEIKDGRKKDKYKYDEHGNIKYIEFDKR